MKRRIAFISEHASPLAALGGVDSGGQNVYVGQLAKHLATLGYEVDIFTRWDDERFPKIIDWVNGVRVIHIKAGPVKYIHKEQLFSYMDEFTSEILSFIQQQKYSYQLFHANFWMSGLVAMNLKKFLGIPFVITFHALGRVRKIYQGRADTFPEERIKIEEQIIQEASHIIAECPQDEEDLISLYHARKEKITIIPCGFDPNEFYPVDKLLARMVLQLDPEENIILQLGRIVPRKGIDTVIKALAKLPKKKRIPTRLVVVGGNTDDADPSQTPEIKRLLKIAKNEGVSQFVTFAGRKTRENLKYYYSAADVFVTTPWYEPFGITPLEAMACGTPVIGSKVGGIQYSVIDGKTGFHVPANNPDILAARLRELFENQKLLKYFKENSIERVTNFFTWSKIANMMMTLYEKTISSYTHMGSRGIQLDVIDGAFDAIAETIQKSKQSVRLQLLDCTHLLTRCLSKNGKVLVCGNGGSAADAQHFAAELVGKFQNTERPGLPIISRTADSAVLTAWANDVGFDDIFSRQVEALGQPGDVLFGISTSGNSQNIIQAFIKAHQKGMTCIAMLGKGGGELLNFCDTAIIIPSYDTQRVQEVHGHIVHTICELVEKQLFTGKEAFFPAQKPIKQSTKLVNKYFLEGGIKSD